MDRKKIKRKELLHIVTSLHALFTASGLEESFLDLRLTIKVAKTIDRWVSCEGHHGLKRAKLLSNIAVRHFMGTPLDDYPLSNRYKRLIQKVLTIVESSDKTLVKVYWVSVFSIFRLYRLDPIVDVSTITGRFSGRLTGLLRFDYLSSLVTTKQSFRSCIDQNWSATWKWHISGASGPLGPLAYTRYLDDLRNVGNSSLGLGLLTLFLSLPYDNKRETANALWDALLDSSTRSEKRAYHSRLAFLSDKGGKTRVIALGDILTQSFLLTVHQRCNLVLRKLKQDGTFDQDSARSYIKKKSALNEDLASIDLTAATDRMPALFQMLVLIYLRVLTPLQGIAWYWVTTCRTFHYNDGKEDKTVRYAVGQPMGLLSSWPVMAISHHFLVRWSFAASSFPYRLENAPYRVLGDDLTLLGYRVADIYLDLISCLGMEYSKDKTYISKGVAEFAKSLFCHGKELTPFPLALLRFNKNTVVSNTLAIVTECKRINLSLTASTLQGLFPKRWRNLVLLASLSPSSPKGGLDLHSRSDFWTFHQYLFAAKIRYFSRLATVRDSTHAFAANDPGKSGKALASPYLQIALDNGSSYPVRYLKDNKRLLNPEVLVGSNWISYCTVCWPDGLPSLGDRNLIPGPTWKNDRDDLFVRSSLQSLDKLLPGYFTVRCSATQVGD